MVGLSTKNEQTSDDTLLVPKKVESLSQKDIKACSSVFTTMPWDGARVWGIESYLSRLREHAQRLGIALPSDFDQQLASQFTAVTQTMHEGGQVPVGSERGLLRIQLGSGGLVSVTTRVLPPLQTQTVESNGGLVDGVRVITLPAPRWEGEITGSKHGGA